MKPHFLLSIQIFFQFSLHFDTLVSQEPSEYPLMEVRLSFSSIPLTESEQLEKVAATKCKDFAGKHKSFILIFLDFTLF